MPAHPDRSFVGRERVRHHWEEMFNTHPSITATVTASATSGDEIWMEWVFRDAATDGASSHQKGVIIAVIDGDMIARTRFHVEPVDAQPGA